MVQRGVRVWRDREGWCALGGGLEFGFLQLGLKGLDSVKYRGHVGGCRLRFGLLRRFRDGFLLRFFVFGEIKAIKEAAVFPWPLQATSDGVNLLAYIMKHFEVIVPGGNPFGQSKGVGAIFPGFIGLECGFPWGCGHSDEQVALDLDFAESGATAL